MAVNPFTPSGNVARQQRLLAEREQARVAELKARKAQAARAAKAPKTNEPDRPTAGENRPAA